MDKAVQTYRVTPGKTYWFEYRCLEAHHSAHAFLWYRSHQKVKVLKMEEPGNGMDEDERAEQGQPAAYQVQFKDGLQYTAMEDELLDSREHFINRDPPPAPTVRESEMTPGSLARHSIEAAGPSVYARKVSTSPHFAGGRTIKWVTEIPMPKFPGYTMRVLISEFCVPVQGGRLSFDIHIVEHPPNAQVGLRFPRNIIGNTTLITTTYEKRSDAYQALYQYVNFIREICQGGKDPVVRQQIADKAIEMQEKHYPALARAGREWDKQAESSENYSEASALELASVLLEINVKDLADASMRRLNQLDHSTLITTTLGGAIHIDVDGNITGRDDLELTNADEVADIAERERRIVKFDVGDLKRHYRTASFDAVFIGDIGYWLDDGTYVPPTSEYRIQEAQTTPKDLAIQAVGLPVMAHTRTIDKGDSVTQKHFQWVSDHDYKVKISIVEIHQIAQIPGMAERVVPHYRVVVRPYVETSPTIYADLSVVKLFDQIPPENRGQMYTALYKMFQDIGAAHKAGMDSSDMCRLLGSIFYKIRLQGEDLR